MDKSSIIQTVGDRLRAIGHGINFEVIEEGVRQEESWWYIPVIATRNGKDVPREITVNIYANIESDLEEEHDLSILFVPAVADEHVH